MSRSTRSDSSSSFFRQALAILAKDLRAELRNRAAINSILLFSLTALVVLGYAVGGRVEAGAQQGALLWVVLFFAAFSGLAHVFLHEEESGTWMALKLAASPEAIYTGKLLFNLLLLLTIALIVVPVYLLTLNAIPAWPGRFLLILIPGCVGLGAAATIVAAIIARARGKGALYGALGFPILLPMLIMAVDGAGLTMTPSEPGPRLWNDVMGLFAYSIMLITASSVLFPTIWDE